MREEQYGGICLTGSVCAVCGTKSRNNQLVLKNFFCFTHKISRINIAPDTGIALSNLF